MRVGTQNMRGEVRYKRGQNGRNEIPPASSKLRGKEEKRTQRKEGEGRKSGRRPKRSGGNRK